MQWRNPFKNPTPAGQVMAAIIALGLTAAAFQAGILPNGRSAAARPQPAAPSPSPSDVPSSPLPPVTSTAGIPIPRTSLVATANDNVIVARRTPDPKGAVVANISHHNLIGQETPFLVVSSTVGWYQVLLPVKPNGTRGWVSADQVRISSTNDFLLATLSSFRLEHYVSGKLTESFPMAIGAPATPTPTGMFYLWAIQTDPGPPYDPVIFALSAFSPTLANWPDGAIVGVHGWSDTSVEGKAVSSGCMRLRPSDASHLQGELTLGVPIEVVA